jgi:multicomponent Na+:H+ antiporter subunit B
MVTGGLLISATGDFPQWGDPASPASLHVSPRYIEKTMEETSVPNSVTSVLADYRGYDTMFETTVIFAAGVACFLLLRVFAGGETPEKTFLPPSSGVAGRTDERAAARSGAGDLEETEGLEIPVDLIVTTMCRLLVPFIQLFGLYVIAHGHSSPGGGFQGGVILGASIILLAISYDLRRSFERMREKVNGLLCAAGVFIYAGVGAICLVLGGNFLDYKDLAVVMPVNAIAARSWGIFFVEIGVGITVMATMICIYNNVASAGRHDEGL